jgi:hypothetical protein
VQERVGQKLGSFITPLLVVAHHVRLVLMGQPSHSEEQARTMHDKVTNLPVVEIDNLRIG